jgi:hypothetical protein
MTEAEIAFLALQEKERAARQMAQNNMFGYTAEMGALEPQVEETQRQQAYADELRGDSEKMPQGEMVGRTFVAPSFTQYGAKLVSALRAGNNAREAKENRALNAKDMKRILGKYTGADGSNGEMYGGKGGMYGGFPQGFDPLKNRYRRGPV